MNLPTRNQNPGDLKDPTTGNFRQFASANEGRAALYNDLTAKMSGNSSTGLGPDSSLIDFSKKYAPASDNNNSLQYAANLANHLGVSPDTKIGTLKGRIDDFANAISKNEGYQGGNQGQSQPATGIQKGVQDIANSTGIPTLAATGEHLVNQVGGLFSPKMQAKADQEQSQGVDLGYFGKVKSLGSSANPVENLTDALGTGVKAGLTASTLESGAGLFKGLMGGMTALETPTITKILTSDLGPEESIGSLGSADKFNILSNVLKNAEPAEQPVIRQAINELAPKVLKEAGVGKGLLKGTASLIRNHPIASIIGFEKFGGYGKQVLSDLFNKYVGNQISSPNPNNQMTINPAP